MPPTTTTYFLPGPHCRLRPDRAVLQARFPDLQGGETVWQLADSDEWQPTGDRSWLQTSDPHGNLAAFLSVGKLVEVTGRSGPLEVTCRFCHTRTEPYFSLAYFRRNLELLTDRQQEGLIERWLNFGRAADAAYWVILGDVSLTHCSIFVEHGILNIWVEPGDRFWEYTHSFYVHHGLGGEVRSIQPLAPGWPGPYGYTCYPLAQFGQAVH